MQRSRPPLLGRVGYSKYRYAFSTEYKVSIAIPLFSFGLGLQQALVLTKCHHAVGVAMGITWVVCCGNDKGIVNDLEVPAFTSRYFRILEEGYIGSLAHSRHECCTKDPPACPDQGRNWR